MEPSSQQQQQHCQSLAIIKSDDVLPSAGKKWDKKDRWENTAKISVICRASGLE